MRIDRPRILSIILTAAITLITLASPFTAAPAVAGETGTLKLMVRGCMGTNWLSNARVDVLVYRPGVGQVDSATAWTSSSGYVEFTFSSLEQADQARVTVTPSGKGSDSGHQYLWVAGTVRANGYWDLGIQSDSLCSDGWYQGNSIIECVYNGS